MFHDWPLSVSVSLSLCLSLCLCLCLSPFFATTKSAAINSFVQVIFPMISLGHKPRNGMAGSKGRQSFYSLLSIVYLGFSWQRILSGLPFPSPAHFTEKETEANRVKWLVKSHTASQCMRLDLNSSRWGVFLIPSPVLYLLYHLITHSNFKVLYKCNYFMLFS